VTAEPPIFHIFGDETSHTGHPFLVYGTMDCSREKLPTIIGLLTAALKGRREFKWSGELSRDLDRFVDTIFQCRAKHGLSFRCMVVNTRHTDHRKYNEGDHLLGLEKYIFYHLLGYARRLPKASPARFCVALDKIKDKHTFEALQRSLNFRVRNELGRKYDLFPDLIAVESHTQILVQAADILAGCIAWVWNERYTNSSDPDRVALATRIAQRVNLPVMAYAKADGVERKSFLNFGYPTLPHQEHRFAIWEMYLRAREEQDLRAKSGEQLACFPVGTTYNDLKEQRFKVEVRCLRCSRRNPNFLVPDPTFGNRLLTDRYRPKCSECRKPGVLLLRPDPLKGGVAQ
jgi:hypothetical protein